MVTPTGDPNQPTQVTLDPNAEAEVLTIDAAGVEAYLRHLSPVVAGRVLSPSEREQITTSGFDAIKPILQAWSQEPAFSEMARRFIEESLFTSGTRNGIDFSLPGNLAEFLTTNQLPWTRIITEPTCYGADGQPMECDTGAPYAAGVLTTRAYLNSRASRFNLTRSSAIMGNFACRRYPIEDALEPRAEKADLIPMFQALTQEEQTDERAQSGFGNGFGCYTCHGQFSLHAQLYVRFDETGLYHADATGIQDPDGELGRSTGGLMASHFADPARANLENSRMLGQPVANLAEAAAVLAASPTFLQCSVERSLNFALGYPKDVITYDIALIDAVVADATAVNPEPTYQDIVVAALSNPSVVISVSSNLRRQTP